MSQRGVWRERTFLRAGIAVAWIGAGVAGGEHVALAGNPSQAVKIEIPAEPMEEALRTLAKEGDVQILFSPALVAGMQAPAVSGQMSVREALAVLLRSTSLEFEIQAPDTVVVKARAARGGGAGRGAAAVPEPSADLGEIVVTAQKRQERLIDVPVPVTEVSAQSLVNENRLRLQDYYASIPGMSFAAGVPGEAFISIRGITTGPLIGNPTVAFTIDDVPYGSSSALASGGIAPDLDPSDLSGIEVLRGPQGTLYGASSIGGLLKYVTVDPSTEAFSARVQMDLNQVYNGPNLGYGARAAANVPVTDTFALRVSGFYRQDPGYIDNLATGQSGVNRVDYDGGRLSGLWKPSDALSLKLSAQYEDARGYGSNDVDNSSSPRYVGPPGLPGYVGPPLGDLQQYYLRGTGTYDRKIQLYAAILKAKLGASDLISVSSFGRNTQLSSADFTPAFGIYTAGCCGIPGYGVAGTPLINFAQTDKFTQEVRATTPLGSRIDWLMGVFYTHESSLADQQILASNPATGAIVARQLDGRGPTGYEEYAVFTDFTFKVTEAFSVQLGGREGWNRQSYSEVDQGSYVTNLEGLTSPVVQPLVKTRDDSFTYLLTPEYKLSGDAMVYARIASGYRPGGPNATCIIYHVPCSFEPDTTRNYEIGFKGEMLDHRLTLDLSAYYIDWKHIQLAVTDPVTFGYYYTNGSRAKSQGLELSVEARPWDSTKVAAWVTFDDAQLTAELPPGPYNAYGVAGSPLPYSSRFSGHVSLDREWLIGDFKAIAGAAVSYVGARQGLFTSPITPGVAPSRQVYSPYAETDLHAGLEQGSWEWRVFASNVTDRRGELGGGLGNFYPAAFQYIQPRTVGLSITRKF